MSSTPPADPHIKLFVGTRQKERIQYAATTLAHSRWVGSWLRSQVLRAIDEQDQGAPGPPRRSDPDSEAEPRTQELRIRLSAAEKARADAARRAAGYVHITHWVYDWLDYFLGLLEATPRQTAPHPGLHAGGPQLDSTDDTNPA